MTKYYEIICDIGVIGVCSEIDHKNNPNLLYTAQQDRVIGFGRITTDEFHAYGDNPWVIPIAKKKYNIDITNKGFTLILELKPLTKLNKITTNSTNIKYSHFH